MQSKAFPIASARFSDTGPDEPAARWVELVEQILICGRKMRDDLTRRTARQRLAAAEFSALWVCRESPPAGLSQNELADALAVSPAQVSGLVERLRCRGLLESRRSAEDRRRQYWRLSDAGQAALQMALNDLADWAQQLDERLAIDGPEDAIRLAELIDRLASVLRSAEPRPLPDELARKGAA